MNKVLKKLIPLSRKLADPAQGLAIIGEGNTSAKIGDGTFWVKASGCQLSDIDESGFSRVDGKKILNVLDKKNLTDEDVAKHLKSALVDPAMRKPSVETFLHALCIFECQANWVGHTHPISVMSILCSKQGAKPFQSHIFPDEIVICGLHVAAIPYIDPGLMLANAVQDELHRYLDDHGYPPKLILMGNHGMVALGKNPKDVLDISSMADKWAKTIIGTFTMGGPNYLTKEQADRIETRPDEDYRRKLITKKG